MKHLNKLVPVFFSAMLGMSAMTSCEGGDIFGVDAPDWITSAADSIAASKVVEEVELEGMMEDVYTIGNTDFTSGWWSSFSKYYVVPDGATWYAQFNLNINSSDNTYYKNFALVVTTDADRSGDGYLEYGAIRFDATNDSTSYNSLWGTNLYFKYAESNLILAPESNADANVQKLGGKVTLTVDRSDPDAFSITIQNSTVTKTYKQPYAMGNLNADASNTNMRFFLVPEGSYMEFLATNIEPIGGCTSALDKEPVTLTLSNVPTKVIQGTTLEEAMAGVTGTVEFEEGVTKDVTAADLIFNSIPDMETTGEKTLIAIYNKTYKGESAAIPVIAHATFNVVTEISSIKVIAQPTNTNYTFALDKPKGIGERLLAFDATGLQVEATYSNGDVLTMDNADLTFTGVPEKAGKQSVTIYTENGKTATVDVNVEITGKEIETKIVDGVFSPSTIGLEDNTGGFWSELINDQKVAAGETVKFAFTNYSSQASNWNNFVVILRKVDLTEYAVVRADNYGWGDSYGACTLGCTAGINWASWLAAMNGAKVTVYVTNYGDGTADVNAWMVGTNGITYFQYYYGIPVEADDLNVSFTVDGCHLVAAE
jgi:hypothetical protein